MNMTAPVDLNACCSIAYGDPLTHWLVGESLHPGGLALTSRLAGLAGLRADSDVLDVGSGRGASAVHLAQSVGCRVTGVTLEEEGVRAGYELAESRGVRDRVRFVQGDIQLVDLPERAFDFVLMECVLSIVPDKGGLLRRLLGMLRPEGRLGLTDVTLSGPMAPALHGVMASVGCVGGAISLEEYRALVEEQGFAVDHTENRRAALSSFLRDLSGRLLMAEVASKLGKVAVRDGLLGEGKGLLALAKDHVSRGVLGYGLLVAHTPA